MDIAEKMLELSVDRLVEAKMRLAEKERQLAALQSVHDNFVTCTLGTFHGIKTGVMDVRRITVDDANRSFQIGPPLPKNGDGLTHDEEKCGVGRFSAPGRMDQSSNLERMNRCSPKDFPDADEEKYDGK